jgi:hypothetical protein
MKRSRTKFAKLSEISASALREFGELRRVANKAVQKALRENRKLGIKGAPTQR